MSTYTVAVQNLEDAIQEIDYLQNEGCIIEQADFDKLRRMQAFLEPMLNGMEAFGNINNENIGKLDFSKLNIPA